MQVTLTIILLPAIVLLLSVLVLVARSRLTLKGNVDVLVNDSRHLTISAGDKLLAALAEQGISLPAACGGRGSCGQCRVTVVSGGGEPLLTEAAQISRGDLARNVRLACQVTARKDLSIQLPENLLEARRWACTVRSNRRVATYLTELVLAVEEGAAFRFEAGAYVLLEAPPGESRFADFDMPPDFRETWEQSGLLDLVSRREEATQRAYSLANNPAEKGVATMIIRIALPPAGAPPGTSPGQVSSYAFGLQAGDEVTIAGPYGSFRARDTDREMVFIGGGAGMGPLRSIILDQLLGRQARRRMTFFYGARSLQDLCYVAEFDALAERFDNFEWQVALSDPGGAEGWRGHTGFIHNVALETYLEAHPRPEEIEYYLCGPPVMSNAVIAMLEDLGVDRQMILLDDFGS